MTPRTGMIDHHLGNKLRIARIAIGSSQDDVAKQLGITFQQVQKYEKGLNRVSAARLYWFTKILGVDFAFFFNGIEQVLKQDLQFSKDTIIHNEDTINFMMNVDLESRETLNLLRNYYSIKTQYDRNKILSIIKLIANNSEENKDEIVNATNSLVEKVAEEATN